MPLQRRLPTLLWAPGIMYLGYGICRLSGIQGATDIDGISAVMRIVFLSFGGGIAYFMTILARWKAFANLRTGMWHMVTLWSLAMIADDAFMIHEQLGAWLSIKDSIPMLLLGVWLLAILFFHRHRMIRTFWRLFAGFVVLSGIAVLGDVITGKEGTVDINGFEFDYEMVCEVAAVLLLVSGFTAQAGAELNEALESRAEAPERT